MTSGPGPSPRGTPDPSQVGPYAIEAPIARGGMGAVYRAVDRRSGRRVALKLVLAGRAATPEQRRRFAREVEAQRALDTDGVVRVLDADAAAEVPWYAMELVDGPSLGAAKADLDLRRRVEVLAGVARAIGAAHAKGYLHRDLKPDNVLLERRGEALVPRVTDFGLAKQVGGESRLTADGAVLGTPHYMAPEQATGEVARAGPPTDVFALGVMLYELATGRLPFEGQTALELLAQIVEADPPPFESGDAREVVDADGPRALLLALEPVARRALEKRPEDRYATAGELALDLERALSGEPTAAGLLRRARPRRRAVVAALGLFALVGLGVGLGAVVLRWRVAREAQAAARAARAQALKELERATATPGVEAVALLAALARAQEAFDLDLDPTLARRARLRLLDLALAAEDGEVALEALTRAPVTHHDLDALPAAERAAALLARGRIRVRVGDPTRPELEALRALGPEHAPALALLEGVVALATPDLEAAAAAFERAAIDPALAPGAHALRAHALGRLGRVADAQAAAERAGSGPEARRRLAEGLLLSLGQPPDPAALDAAWEALAAALRAAPADLRVARRLLALARATGRAWEAAEALEAAAARPTAARELTALAAEARHLVDPRADSPDPTDAPEPPEQAEAALARADRTAVRGAADPYAALAGGDGPRAVVGAARAARARWLARRDPAAAREALKALDDGLFGPLDLPPDPLTARRLRDAGWAHLDLGARDRAGALARDALRGLPLDLDALALLTRVDAAAGPRLHAALRLEAGELDGPLGRGLLLVRAGLAYGRPALAAEGADLLRARLAGDPGVFPAALFVARAAGEPDPTDPLPWLDALALVPEPPPASPEERADAAALAAGGWTDDPVADRERFRRACALDPLSARARWELAHLRHRTEAGSIDALLEFARYARLKPNTAVRFVQRVNDTWKAVAASSPRVDVERARALAPDDPTYRLPDVADRYLGVVYAGSTRPAYTRAAPLEVRRALDALLARDARLIGFLAVRAHLSELLGRPGAAERDLDLLERAFADERDAQEKHLDGFWVTLQRVAVRAARRPNRPALEALARLPRPLPHDGSDGNDLDNWLRRDPIFEPIRRDPDFQDLLARWR